MRKLFILLFLLSIAANAEVYKQVNPDGSVTFTDAPRDADATPVPLPPVNTFRPPAPPPVSSKPRSSQADAGTYTGISITSPANETTLRDNAGNLAVAASVTPGLQAGHKMVLMDNGKLLAESTSGSFSLSNLDRGAHRLTVQVQDDAGKVLLSSEPVTVYLHRHSIRQ